MQPNGLPIKVLLIEDDEDDFCLIRDLLSKVPVQRYEIEWVTGYVAGLEALVRGAFDICLLDYGLGAQSGLDLFKEARSSGGMAPVIFLTGRGNYGVDLQSMQAGVSDYLTKDEINASLLERSIRYSIDRMHVNEKLREHRRQAEEFLTERLRFEKMLAEISTSFLNLPADQVELEIRELQRRVCQWFGFDRSVIWEIPPEGGALRLTHFHQPVDGTPVAEPADLVQLSTSDWALESPEPTPGFVGMHADAYFPWVTEQVRSGMVISFSKADALPLKAWVDKEFFRRYSVKSCAVIPLVAGGAVMGCITFESMREERDWPEPLEEQLRFIAQIFANAIARARADRTVRESEERLRLAAESAHAGMWSLDVSSRKLWATGKARELFGIDPEEELTFEGFLQYIHPEDRERVRDIALRSIGSGQDTNLEYRALRPDGSVRWMASRGCIYPGSQGESDRLMGVSVDITDRKQMEEQILKAADEWQTTFNSIQDLIMIMDRDLRVLRVNAATASFLGMPLDEIIGSRCHALMHGSEGALKGCPAERAFASKRHEEMEVFLEKKKAWVLVSADPILDSTGDVTGVVHSLKDITDRKRMEEQLQARLEEIEGLKKHLEEENIHLREEVKLLFRHDDIVAKSEAMQRILLQVEQVAPTNSTVLITGETGTGKGVIARAIHRLSTRSSRPLVTVNCASLPPTLIESELFGREKGAYTGAISRMMGRFEVADEGTLLLDEIGELPMEVQAKLLRILEEGRFERLGSTKTLHVNVRLLAATNRDLAQLVKEGKFRSDLYYRMNVFPIRIPPLRDRPDDIPPLVWSFVKQFEKEIGKHIQSIPRRRIEALQRHTWPGNARELRNIIEHAMIVSRGTTLELEAPSTYVADEAAAEPRNLQDVERQCILQALQETRWRVSGKGGAAEILGLKPTTLEARMKKLGIHRSKS